MKPVDQSRLHALDTAPGNCFQACIASIFEVELDEVPDEAVHWKPGMGIEGDSYDKHWHDLMGWLAERNLVLVGPVEYSGEVKPSWNIWCIISGVSHRDPSVRHAVVGLGSEVAHDPHPSRKGLAEGVRRYYYFVPLNPELNAREELEQP